MSDQIPEHSEKTPIHEPIKKEKETTGLLSDIIGFFATTVGKVLIGMLLGAIIVNMPIPSPDLKISDPKTGDFIEVQKNVNGKDICVIEVNGTATDFWSKFYFEWIDGWFSRSLRALGVEKNIWLAVNNHDGPGQWWPQQPVYCWNGSWHSGPVSLGGEGFESNGREYDIAVVILDKRDNIVFKHFMEIGKTCNEYSPVTLPYSAVITDKVNITRTNRSDVRTSRGL